MRRIAFSSNKFNRKKTSFGTKAIQYIEICIQYRAVSVVLYCLLVAATL